MSSTPSTGVLPMPVKVAAALLLVYAAIALLGPILLYQAGGRLWLRVLVRVIGAVVMAWGLYQRARWAWWVAVVFSGLGALTGILGLAVTGRMGPLLMIPRATVLAPIAVAALAGTLVLLVLRESRAAFQISSS
jgi:hypothetical protein